MRVIAIRIFVRDWERALRFYTETLGLGVAYRSDAFGWAELETGEAKLALERADPDDAEGQALVGRYVGASLAVDDIYGLCETLAARGVAFEGGPAEQPWGGVLAHLRDPEGNVLTLVGRPAA